MNKGFGTSLHTILNYVYLEIYIFDRLKPIVKLIENSTLNRRHPHPHCEQTFSQLIHVGTS